MMNEELREYIKDVVTFANTVAQEKQEQFERLSKKQEELNKKHPNEGRPYIKIFSTHKYEIKQEISEVIDSAIDAINWEVNTMFHVTTFSVDEDTAIIAEESTTTIDADVVFAQIKDFFKDGLAETAKQEAITLLAKNLRPYSYYSVKIEDTIAVEGNIVTFNHVVYKDSYDSSRISSAGLHFLYLFDKYVKNVFGYNCELSIARSYGFDSYNYQKFVSEGDYPITNMRAYKNGKLKVTFKSPEAAAEFLAPLMEGIEKIS